MDVDDDDKQAKEHEESALLVEFKPGEFQPLDLKYSWEDEYTLIQLVTLAVVRPSKVGIETISSQVLYNGNIFTIVVQWIEPMKKW